MSSKRRSDKKKVGDPSSGTENVLLQELQRLQFQNAELLKFQQFYQQQQFVAQQQAALNSTVVITCPARATYYNPAQKNIFLGGPLQPENWQKEIIHRLRGHSAYVYNPRRDDWKPLEANRISLKEDSLDGSIKKDAQFTWELDHLERSNCAVFWFPWDQHSSPGMFLQLGRLSTGAKHVFIGIHSRNRDKKIIYEFVKTMLPSAYVTSSLEKLGASVANWCSTGKMPESNSSGSSDSNSITF